MAPILNAPWNFQGGVRVDSEWRLQGAGITPRVSASDEHFPVQYSGDVAERSTRSSSYVFHLANLANSRLLRRYLDTNMDTRLNFALLEHRGNSVGSPKERLSPILALTQVWLRASEQLVC